MKIIGYKVRLSKKGIWSMLQFETHSGRREPDSGSLATQILKVWVVAR